MPYTVYTHTHKYIDACNRSKKKKNKNQYIPYKRSVKAVCPPLFPEIAKSKKKILPRRGVDPHLRENQLELQATKAAPLDYVNVKMCVSVNSD